MSELDAYTLADYIEVECQSENSSSICKHLKSNLIKNS